MIRDNPGTVCPWPINPKFVLPANAKAQCGGNSKYNDRSSQLLACLCLLLPRYIITEAPPVWWMPYCQWWGIHHPVLRKFQAQMDQPSSAASIFQPHVQTCCCSTNLSSSLINLWMSDRLLIYLFHMKYSHDIYSKIVQINITQCLKMLHSIFKSHFPTNQMYFESEAQETTCLQTINSFWWQGHHKQWEQEW